MNPYPGYEPVQRIKIMDNYVHQSEWQINIDQAKLEYYRYGGKLYKLSYYAIIIGIVTYILFIIAAIVMPFIIGSAMISIFRDIMESLNSVK